MTAEHGASRVLDKKRLRDGIISSLVDANMKESIASPCDGTSYDWRLMLARISAEHSSGADVWMEALRDTLPYLPDYKLVKSCLEELLISSFKQFPVEVDALLLAFVHKWVKNKQRFRAFLAQWLLEHQDFQATTTQRQQEWVNAIEMAAMDEDDPRRRILLLQLRRRCNPEPNKDNRGEKVTLPPPPTTLLDVMWRHTDELASKSLLCATKWSALVSQSSNAIDDDVLIRLRWYRALKPTFFEPFIQYVNALKVFARSPTSNKLQLSPTLAAIVVDNTAFPGWRGVLEAAGDPEGEVTGVALWCAQQRQQRTKSNLIMCSTSWRHLLVEIDGELDDAPSEVFAAAALALVVMINSIRDMTEEQQVKNDLMALALRVLFQSFANRTEPKCVELLLVVLQQNLNWLQHSVWAQHPTLYLDFVYILCEARLWCLYSLALQAVLDQVLCLLIQQCSVELVTSFTSQTNDILPPSVKDVCRQHGSYPATDA